MAQPMGRKIFGDRQSREVLDRMRATLRVDNRVPAAFLNTASSGAVD
jgi:hypothetical protein